MGLVSPKRAKAHPKGSLIAALDLGTTKSVCFIARVAEDGGCHVIGIGHHAAEGLRFGTVVDLVRASQSAAHAIAAAEKMAGVEIDQAAVSLSGGHPRSQTVRVGIDTHGHAITEADMARIMRGAESADLGQDDQIVHAIPTGYVIDGVGGIRDPRGMIGGHLSVDLHLVSASLAAVRNLGLCMDRCELEMEAITIGGYASALAALVPDERELGATLIELGGGTTSIAVFFDDRLVFCDTLPVGGCHVTSDVARGLTTTIAHAERIKTLYGSCIPNIADEHDVITVPQVGEDDLSAATQIPRSILNGIIRPRLEEILELARGRLEASRPAPQARRRVVLAGGASQLQGLRELAQRVLDKQVRLGRPTGVTGLAEATSGPAFSTGVGLLLHAARNPGELLLTNTEVEPVSTGLMGRIGGWFREHF